MARVTKRLGAGCALVFALLFVGVAHAAYDVVYATGVLSPGYGATSNWDVSGNRWFCNTLQRDVYSWGLVTFIDNTGYDWHYTTETFDYVTQKCITTTQSMFQKVCHCKNTHWELYGITCTGRRNGF